MAVVPSILGVLLGMFNNVGNLCYVGDYPKGCRTNDEIECERGQKFIEFGWVMSGWLIIFLFVSLPINLIVLCCALSKQDREVKLKYKYNSTVSTIPISEQDGESKRGLIARLRRIRSRRIKSSCNVKKARTQALLYILSSFLCLSFSIFNKIINKPGGLFIIRCLGQFFYPLQGFFNFFNYTRPRVLRLQEEKLANNFFHALYLATFETDANLKRRNLQRLVSKQYQCRYDQQEFSRRNSSKRLEFPAR